MSKISLVILTLNEIVGLREVFPKIQRTDVDEIIAVDGGSTDGTVQYLEAAGVPVYPQSVRGRGEAFRVAFEKAGGDALLFFSPDGNEDPADIGKFRSFLDQGADLVIGNRMSGGGHNEEDEQLLKLRKWANNAFTWIANITWNRGPYVYDTINGFRAIRRSAWEILKPNGPGYTIEYQTSIRAFKTGLKIAEFPTYEGPRLDERVGSPSVKTGVAFLKLFYNELMLGSRV